MNKKRVSLIAAGMAVVGSVFTGGYVMGQQSTDAEIEQWRMAFRRATVMGGDSDKTTQDVALKIAARSPKHLEAIGRTMVDWNDLAKPREMTYEVITMYQNQRIIELLEQLNKKPAPANPVSKKG